VSSESSGSLEWGKTSQSEYIKSATISPALGSQRFSFFNHQQWLDPHLGRQYRW
jgi:hypothetical protein